MKKIVLLALFSVSIWGNDFKAFYNEVGKDLFREYFLDYDSGTFRKVIEAPEKAKVYKEINSLMVNRNQFSEKVYKETLNVIKRLKYVSPPPGNKIYYIDVTDLKDGLFDKYRHVAEISRWDMVNRFYQRNEETFKRNEKKENIWESSLGNLFANDYSHFLVSVSEDQKYIKAGIGVFQGEAVKVKSFFADHCYVYSRSPFKKRGCTIEEASSWDLIYPH